jgi:hypothetical protein
MPKRMSKPIASSDKAPNLNELDNKASMFAFTITQDTFGHHLGSVLSVINDVQKIFGAEGARDTLERWHAARSHLGYEAVQAAVGNAKQLVDLCQTWPVGLDIACSGLPRQH